MANYNVDIAVALKGAKQLTSFNREVKATSTSIDAFAKQLKSAAKDQTLLVKNFDNLNLALVNAKKNFNEVASGTSKQITSTKQLIAAEKELNKELSLRNQLLTGGKAAQGTGLAVDPVLKSIQRNARKNRTIQQPSSGFLEFSKSADKILAEKMLSTKQEELVLQKKLLALEIKSAEEENRKLQTRGELNRQTAIAVNNARFIGQSSPLTSPVFRGYSSPIGPMPMPPMQGPILPSAAASMRREQARAFPRERGDFGFGLAGDPIAKSIRRNKEKQFRDLLREKKANKDIRDLKAKQLRLERANNRALKERVATTRTLAKTSQSTGGGMRGGGLFRGGARGALSNAMIGGGFPLLFGQGALGAVGGGVGGALGGAIGGGFGFSLSIIGTAIAQRIQEAIDFRKEIEKVNVAIEKTGGTSKISAYDITSLSKSLNITKDEALQAANAFAAFGAQSALALAETFRDRSTFDLYANLNRDAKTFIGTVDTLFKKNELGIGQAQKALEILNQRGLKEASIFVESLKFQEKIKKEISEQVPLQEDINAAQAVYESFFDKMSGRPLKNYMLLNKERQKEIQLLITAKGQMEARIGTEEERFQKRMSNVRAEIEAQRELTKTIERQLIIQQPKDELERLLDPLMQVDALGKSIGASFSESFKGIISGSMNVQQALANLFQRTADHFLDMAAQMLAAQIRTGIFGLFGFTTNPFLRQTPLPDNYNELRFGYGRANGGPVKGGTSYIVGERGPEMFTPGVSGMITPNHALGGSTNVVVNVDASGSNVEGDEAQAQQLGQAISQAIQAELIQQQRPGGLLYS